MNTVSPKVPLKVNQYYQQEYDKKYIFLHHTAGETPESTINWWNSKPDHIATPYIIDRDGTIFELYSPKFWAYALGVKGGTPIEKASIHIELAAKGKLTHSDNGHFYFIPNLRNKIEVPESEVISFREPYRGSYHYHKYTMEQINALGDLLDYLGSFFKINLQTKDKFYEYQPDFLTNIKNGLWSHTSIRLDKSDIIPQPELLSMLKGFNTSGL